MIKSILIALLLSFSLSSYAETVEIEKNLAIKMLVASYVHGFNEFDITVVGFDDSVSIGIYVTRNGQTRKSAELLAERFREQVPHLLKMNEWSKSILVTVTIY